MNFRRYVAAAMLALMLLGVSAPAEQADLTELIEGQLFWHEFAPMPEAEVAEAVAALGEIADAYAFTERVSTDGAYGYLLTMADGRELVVQKATDSCGTMIFGSAACYEIGRAENARFWEIFADVHPR